MSSSSSFSSSRSTKRYTKEQLHKHLKILGEIPPPPPLDLPPSPPPSRSSSPAPGTKRRVGNSNHNSEPSKRPRLNSNTDRLASSSSSSASSSSQHQHKHKSALGNSHSSSSLAHPHNTEPSEDGELKEESPITHPPRANPGHTSASSCLGTTSLPVRRPKRGKPTNEEWDEMYQRHYTQGRNFKYSGDARWHSTFNPGHKDHKPLPHPPPPNSSYHKHGATIARLEFLDGLLSFVYAMWTKDYSRAICTIQSWETVNGVYHPSSRKDKPNNGYLEFCQAKWAPEQLTDEAERAFFSLICMIDGFIHQRKLAYTISRRLNPASRQATAACEAALQRAITSTEHMSATYNAQSATPIMLPSPASITTANSANSTPTGRSADTPNAGPSSGSSPSIALDTIIPARMARQINVRKHISPEAAQAISKITIPVEPNVVQDITDVSQQLTQAQSAFNAAQPLTLSTMARHFPKTFGRLVSSTLTAQEEHEPVFGDDESELFWPPQAPLGEGIGWLCLMGKAMTREFGEAYGYQGARGLVQKPDQDQPSSRQNSARPSAVR